ncbi:MAG: AI-2E family transporter [Phycisphaerae bacterium]|nr:AI-2E family transporter [Phycisphaerae bacterium]
MHEPEKRSRSLATLHLWEIAALREVIILVLALGLLWAAYMLRGVLFPILVAIALAYVVDPVVTGLRARYRYPRTLTALAILLLLIAGLAAFGTWLMPRFVEQVHQLSEKAPVYWEKLRQYLPDAENLPSPAAALESVDPGTVLRSTIGGAGHVFGVLGGVIGSAGYLVVAGILIPILFVFFSARFDRMRDFREYLPSTRRDRIWELLSKIDAAFSGYVRGQLVVAVFTTMGFCVGFSLIGVPYWFVVSLVGGVLSLIPYGQCSGWILAMLLQGAETLAGDQAFSFFDVLLAPSLVYLVTQSLETWVITPLVQGESTRLHPIVVLVSLLVGGALAGVIGLILAIPVTASVRTLFQELAVPRLRRWAEAN